MVIEGLGDTELFQIAMLQPVIRPEHDGRSLCQGLGIRQIGQLLGTEQRAGQGPIAHGAQGADPGSGQWLTAGAETGRHLAGSHPTQHHVLVLDHQIQQHALLPHPGPHRRRPPVGQAVGIEGDAQPLRRLLGQPRYLTAEIGLQQAHLLDMTEQAQAGRGGLGRCLADQHRLADPGFEQFDALGHRRLRQPQSPRGTFEATLFHHHGQGFQQFVIDHRSG